MRLFSFLFILVLAACQNEEPSFSAPPLDEIEEISAIIYDSTAMYDPANKEPNSSRFKIPRSSYNPLLSTLDGAQEHPDPKKWQALGNLKLTLESREIAISLYSTNKGTFAFKVKDTYYRGPSEQSLLKLITREE